MRCVGVIGPAPFYPPHRAWLLVHGLVAQITYTGVREWVAGLVRLPASFGQNPPRVGRRKFRGVGLGLGQASVCCALRL